MTHQKRNEKNTDSPPAIRPIQEPSSAFRSVTGIHLRG